MFEKSWTKETSKNSDSLQDILRSKATPIGHLIHRGKHIIYFFREMPILLLVVFNHFIKKSIKMSGANQIPGSQLNWK